MYIHIHVYVYIYIYVCIYIKVMGERVVIKRCCPAEAEQERATLMALKKADPGVCVSVGWVYGRVGGCAVQGP